MTGIEFVDSGSGTMIVGGIVVDGVYAVDEHGGQQAPERKVEEGYDYSTRVGPDPIHATISAWTDVETYSALATLRKSREPFPVSIGAVSLDACALEDLTVHTEGTYQGAYEISIEIRQIQQASSGTAVVKVLATTGTKTSAAGGGYADGPAPVPVPGGSDTPQTPDSVTTESTNIISPPEDSPTPQS